MLFDEIDIENTKHISGPGVLKKSLNSDDQQFNKY